MSTGQKQELYRCPNWRTCKVPCDQRDPHEHQDRCDVVTTACPACIKYVEPQPEQCPECGHPIARHGKEGCEDCACCNTPADLQPKHCTHPTISKRECPVFHVNLKCEGCAYFEQPAPHMPLIGSLPDEEKLPIQKQQRDADMVWHNSQVSAIASKAVKEFAEATHTCRLVGGVEEDGSVSKAYVHDTKNCLACAHIRAMAEGKDKHD